MIADDFRPMLWGMCFLTLGFAAVFLLGLLWGIVAMGGIGLIGMLVGVRMLLKPTKKKEVKSE